MDRSSIEAECGPMAGGMPTTPARFSEAICEQYARRVYVHLRAGRFDAAESVVRHAATEIPRLCGLVVTDPGQVHIADLGLHPQTAAALERFGIVVIHDLDRISPDMIRERTQIGNRAIALLIDACIRAGYPWPANGE